MNTAVLVATVIVLAYAGVVLFLWRYQERIVFQPPAAGDSTADDAERLTYHAKDGVRLVAFVVRARAPGRPIVLAFHGNAIIARWMIPWAYELSRRSGATVVLPEYRGYDGLEGTPTYDGARLDAEAALQAVCEHFNVAASEVVLYGHSLGTAVASELASTAPPRSLILESPFSSARDMAARWPVAGLRLLWKQISRVHYDTADRVRRIESVVHVAHGERDIIIPVRMGRAVHAAARKQGDLLIVPEAGHNDVAVAAGDAYWRWITQASAAEPQ